MANWTVATGDASAVKLWAREVWIEAKKQIFWRQFIGSSTDINCVIQEKEDFKKSQGDKVTFDLIMKLTGAGISGDSTLEGNEEAPNLYTDSVTIDQIRHAIRLNGRMSEKRTAFDLRDTAKKLLAIWIAETLEDQYFFRAMAGDTTLTFGQAQTAPSSNNQIFGGAATTDATIDNTCKFDITLLDKARVKAVTASPKIRPIRIEGKNYYICVLHPYQVRDLRTNTNTGQFLDIQKAAGERGRDNPIFEGSLGVYNQVILFEHEFVRTYSNWGGGGNLAGARANFCGAQAAVVAYNDDAPDYYEKSFDYGNQMGFMVGRIWGLKKAVFNSQDYATIAIDTYAASS